jgi:Ca2+:H+ antiporter
MADARMPWWAWVWPASGWLVLLIAAVAGKSALVVALGGVTLLVTVFAAVYHAEVIAHRVGEPFGTLVLALAVTVIEAALIVSVMLADPAGNAALARDTVFSAVMIVCNGIVGACLLLGGARYHEQHFQLQGATAALAVLTVITGLTMVLPNVTNTPGPQFSTPQLIFAALISLALYCSYIFVQAVRHRDYFLPVNTKDEDAHSAPPSAKATFLSVFLLLVSLVAIVGLAKMLTPAIEAGIEHLGVPRAVVGIVIAALVLLPEGLAAVRAAHADRLQTSLNLALGSVLATIGLTIPAVAAVSIAIDQPIQLGLDPKGVTLLALTLLLSVITLGTSRTTVLQGIVHLVLFADFLFFAIVP